MSLKFVKVVPVYPHKMALQTESSMSIPVAASERHLLDPMIETAVRQRGLPGYIDHDGQFRRV